jgi:glutamine synthetase
LYAAPAGIRRELDPGAPCNENLYQLGSVELAARGIERLPHSLPDAVAELQADSALCAGLGQAFIDEFAACKYAECDESLLEISPAEFRRYVDFF